MNPAASSLVQFTARLLEPCERDVVLGDLAEAHAGPLHAARQVLGLGLRRHAALWLRWHPWLTGPGLALPGSFLLMGVSLSVSQTCLQLVGFGTPQIGAMTAGNLFSLLTQICLLLGWSWTGGFVVGCLSRRTLWASILLCFSPCLLCLSTFHIESLSRVCLLWFLIPAALGVRQGLRRSGIRLASALAMATALTLAMLLTRQGAAQRWWSPPPWLLNGVMSWPAWYLVARAACRRAEVESG
jgi:hypothetical protein